MITRLAADHGVEGDNVPQTAQQKEEARGKVTIPIIIQSFDR